MKIKCEYCGVDFNDTEVKCPSCGAPNPAVVRTAEGEPITIEGLKKWYEDRGLPPYETTRFFIGIDYKKPRAFGIYKDEKTGNFVVYKNKDNGQRAVRYEGTDEAYAVNELLQRLKQEIIQQKMNNVNKASAGKPTYKYKKSSKSGKIRKIVIGCIIAFFIIFYIWSLVDSDRVDYYRYGNYYYCSGPGGWYYYDDDDDWTSISYYNVPEQLKDSNLSKDFYYTPTWDSSTQITDFTQSSAYYDYVESNKSDSGSSFDWDSGSSWDSGGTDWGSDW